MSARAKKKPQAKAIWGHLLLIAFSVAFSLPFAWLIITSLKPGSQVFEMPPRWIPHPVRWSNYADAIHFIPFLRYTWNTLYVSLAATFATVLSCTMCAYGLSMVRWRWADFFFVVMLATVMLPPQVTLIPVFLIFKKLGWIGTFRPLVVPYFFGNAFYIFLMRQFFKTIPKDLVEAAMIDGCSHFEIYWRIVLRLSKPILAVVVFFTFTAVWNDFMGPLIYLNDDRMYTLSLGLQQFIGQQKAKWDLLMAASVIMIAPVIALFFLLQKSFVEGVNLTGLKG
jgi:ABC-type glycerol-3-phosphate transport system permease component